MFNYEIKTLILNINNKFCIIIDINKWIYYLTFTYEDKRRESKTIKLNKERILVTIKINYEQRINFVTIIEMEPIEENLDDKVFINIKQYLMEYDVRKV